MVAVANVEFDTTDLELIKFLKLIAIEHADQSHSGAGTGARILLEKLKQRKDLVDKLFSETGGGEESPSKEKQEPPKPDSRRRASK